MNGNVNMDDYVHKDQYKSLDETLEKSTREIK